MTRKCDTCGARLSGAALEFRERDQCIACRAKEYAEDVRADEAAENAPQDAYFLAGPTTMTELRDAEVTGEWARELN